MAPSRRPPAAEAADPVAKLNWAVHTWILVAVAAGWLAIVYTHPDRSGLSGLGDALLVVLSGAAALAYALVSTVALAFVARTRLAALWVHGLTWVAVACGLAATVAIR